MKVTREIFKWFSDRDSLSSFCICGHFSMPANDYENLSEGIAAYKVQVCYKAYLSWGIDNEIS